MPSGRRHQRDQERTQGWEEARASEDRYDEGRDEIRKLEQADEVPMDPREWPGGKARYLTFGGGEGRSDDAFGDGVMAKLGPGDVQPSARRLGDRQG
jgi:hypothetical protein